MNVINKRPKEELYVWASGRGEDTYVKIHQTSIYGEPDTIYMSYETFKELVKVIPNVEEDADKRNQDREEEED